MSIFSVAVSLRSTTRSLEELIALAGADPTRSHSIGDRISMRTESNRRKDTYWTRMSGVREDTWTLAPHWPAIAPILESLAAQDMTGVRAQLAIGTRARWAGYSFHLEPEHLQLLVRAGCAVWIDSYQGIRVSSDLPDDYPFPEGGTLHSARGFALVRRRMNLALRNVNPLGKVRRHREKPSGSNT